MHDWIDAMLISEENPYSILYSLNDKPASLIKVLSFLHKEEIVTALSQQGPEQMTILGNIACHRASLEAVMEIIPGENKETLLSLLREDLQKILARVMDDLEYVKFLMETHCKSDQVISLITRNLDGYGYTLFHHAAQHEQVLIYFISLFKNSSDLENFLTLNPTVISAAIPNSNSLKKLLKRLSPDKRLQTLISSNIFNQELPDEIRLEVLKLIPIEDRYTLLTSPTLQFKLSLDKRQSISSALSLFPEEQHKAILQSKDIFEKTVFFELGRDIDSLKRALSYFTCEEQIALLTLQDKFHCFPLQMIAEHPDALAFLLDLFPEQDWIKLLSPGDGYLSATIIDRASRGKETFKVLTSKVGVEKIREIILAEPHRLYWLLYNVCDDVLDDCSEIFTAQEIRRTLQTEQNGLWFFDNINLTPKAFKLYFSLIPKEERFETLARRSASQDPMLFQHALDINKLEVIFDLLTENDQYYASKLLDTNNRTVFHYIAGNTFKLDEDSIRRTKIISLFKKLINLYSIDLRITVLSWPTSGYIYGGNTVMHLLSTNEKMLACALDSLNEVDQYKAVTLTDQFGNTVIQSAVQNPASLELCLKCIPEQWCLTEISRKSSSGGTALINAAYYTKSFQILYYRYPANQRLIALCQTKSYSFCAALSAASNYEYLEMIKKDLGYINFRTLFDIEDRIYGSIFHYAAVDPRCLKLCLDACDIKEAKSRLIFPHNYIPPVFYIAAQYPDTLNMLYDYFFPKKDYNLQFFTPSGQQKNSLEKLKEQLTELKDKIEFMQNNNTNIGPVDPETNDKILNSYCEEEKRLEKLIESMEHDTKDCQEDKLIQID